MPQLTLPPFDEVMRPKAFVHAIAERLEANTTGSPDEGPYIYGIRVTHPTDWQVDENKFGPATVTASPIPAGLLHSTELYTLEWDVVQDILLAFCNADELEVKHADEPGEPWTIDKVRIRYG